MRSVVRGAIPAAARPFWGKSAVKKWTLPIADLQQALGQAGSCLPPAQAQVLLRALHLPGVVLQQATRAPALAQAQVLLRAPQLLVAALQQATRPPALFWLSSTQPTPSLCTSCRRGPGEPPAHCPRMSARLLDTRREIHQRCTPARLRRGAVPLRLDAVLCSKGVSRKVEDGEEANSAR